MAFNQLPVSAVNQIVEVMQLPPMAGALLPSAQNPVDTTSEYARAEQILNRVNLRVQRMGWPQNYRHGEQFTSNGSGVVSLANFPGLLWIRPTGKDAHRNIIIFPDALDGNQLKFYDANRGTFNLSTEGVAQTTIFCDSIRLIPFASLDMLAQRLIVAHAREEFLLAVGPSSPALESVRAEVIAAELAVQRLQPMLGLQPPNTSPNIIQQGQQQNA